MELETPSLTILIHMQATSNSMQHIINLKAVQYVIIIHGFRYIDNMRCVVSYKLGTSCSKMRFSCNNVDLPNIDRKCKNGDTLRVGKKM